MKPATSTSGLGSALRRYTATASFGLTHAALLAFGLGAALSSSSDEPLLKISHADVHIARADDTTTVEKQPSLTQAAAPAPLTPASSVGKLQLASRGQGMQYEDPFAAASPLSPEMAKVRDWITSTYRVSGKALEPALVAAEESAEAHGFDPLLIVAIMAVESSFNPKAVSHMGAQGLMQVIPRFHQDKIGPGRDKYALFDPVLNVRVGTLVLQEGVQRYGTLQRALQYYNGSLKDPNARYTRKVMAVKERLHLATGREQSLVASAS